LAFDLLSSLKRIYNCYVKSEENVDLMSVREPYVDINLWHSGHPNHSFESWEKTYSRRFADGKRNSTNLSEKEKPVVREIYLMSKYIDKWIVNMWCKKQHRQSQANLSPGEAIIASPLWLKSIIFNKSSRTVRKVGVFIEGFFSIINNLKNLRWPAECWIFLVDVVGTDRRKW